MKASELRTKDVPALEKEVTDLLRAHFGLRMQKGTQQLTNHSQLKNTRRDIARAKTILAEKKGAAKLAGQIEIAHTKIKELEAELSALDFVIDDDDFTLSVVSSRPLDKIISDRIEKELGTDDGIEARFTSAQIEMMTVASLEDAERILNSVSALC
jgi:large subunit ribosomal protein L29